MDKLERRRRVHMLTNGHVDLPPGRKVVAVSGKQYTAKGHNDRTPVQPDVRMPDKVKVNPDLVIRDITYPKASPTPSDFKMVDRVIAMVRARARQAIADRVLGYKPMLMLPALGQTSEMCYSYHSIKAR